MIVLIPFGSALVGLRDWERLVGASGASRGPFLIWGRGAGGAPALENGERKTENGVALRATVGAEG